MMPPNVDSQGLFKKLAFLIIAVFFGFAFSYHVYKSKEMHSRMQEHARIISASIWTLNPKIIEEYLHAMVLQYSYEHILIKDVLGTMIVGVEEANRRPIENLLIKLRLIPKVRLSADITYDGEAIGKFEVLWLDKSIYAYGYGLIVCLLMLAICHMYARMFRSKENLEAIVEARTAQLQSELAERRQIEAALMENQAKYRLVEDHLTDVIWARDLDWNLTYISPSIWRQSGFSVQETETLPLEAIMPPESLKKAERMLAEELAIEASGASSPDRTRTFELEMFRKDGSAYPCEMKVSFLREKNGKAMGIIGVTRDITERKKTEQVRNLFISAIEQVAEIVIITDYNGIIQYVNAAFEQTTGFTRNEAIGKFLFFQNDGAQDESNAQNAWDTLKAGQSWAGRLMARKKNDGLYTEESIISPVRDTDGRVVKFVAAKRDVTDEIRLREQLFQAQKMESVGRLAGGVAHDFNNMLAIILGHAEMALEKVGPDQDVSDDLEAVRGAAERSADLVRQLLAYARKQAIRPKTLSLNKTVESMLKMLKRIIGEPIDLIWRPGDGLWPVKMDPSQVDQILANLCVNARDAITGPGNIIIQTENRTVEDLHLHKHPASCDAGDYVMLSVIDDGCGMDADVLENLFEPFFSTKGVGAGAGLGLATVYGIVSQNKGFIDVVSRPKAGTTVRIFLPRQSAPSSVIKGKNRDGMGPDEKETILLIEDEPTTLRMVRLMLESMGYLVLATTAPEEAIEWALTHPGRIGLMISDLIMPAMNGRELAQRISGHRPGIRCLFMSGYTADMISRQGIIEEDIYLIEKPFTKKLLAEKLLDITIAS